MNHSDFIMFSNQFEVIPTGYLELTNTEECADGSAYWIEPMTGQRTRNTRQTAARAPQAPAMEAPVTLCEIWVVETNCEVVILKISS